MQLVIVIPAAGASSRMRGRDKLLEDVDGIALLTRTVARAVATGWRVVVALSKGHPRRVMALDGMDVERVFVRDASDGMGATIRDAMARVPEETLGVMILPADMPELETADFQRLGAAFLTETDRVWRAADDSGTPGHPVIFPRRLFTPLRQLSDPEGARTILAGEDVALFPLPGRRALTDLDTPEDWASWRAQ